MYTPGHVLPKIWEPRAPRGGERKRRRLARHNGDVITLLHDVEQLHRSGGTRVDYDSPGRSGG